jgi:hypothetical protein
MFALKLLLVPKTGFTRPFHRPKPVTPAALADENSAYNRDDYP